MYVKKLRYFTINECLDKLGFDELTQLSDSITALLLIRQNDAKQSYQNAVGDLIPKWYNHPNKDWDVNWIDDKSVITWSDPNWYIKIDKTEFNILINNVHIKVISPTNKNCEIITELDLDSSINVVDKNIKTVREWVYFILSVYNKLSIHYDILYNKYYDTLNKL
jgi:hypothetical protein